MRKVEPPVRLRTGIDQDAPYPEDARERRIEADCRIRLVIDERGRVGEIASIECDETGLGFEESIREHIEREFRFHPAIEDGQPTEQRILWTHQFRLRD